LVSQVKPGNDLEASDGVPLEGQDHFPMPFGDDDTTAPAELAVPLFL
jgi:hypothetical protein